MADFLKQEQSQNETFKAGFYNPDAVRRKARRILVLKTGIAGLRLKDNKRVEEASEPIQPGTELKLYRDSDNKYDQWAIEVRTVEDQKIGYVTRFKNEAIARLMDAGKKFVAVIDEPEQPRMSDPENPLIREWKAPTENMELPFSVYLEE